MQLITQGKTNFIYLAIILVVAALAGTGIFLYKQEIEKEEGLNYGPVGLSKNNPDGNIPNSQIGQPSWKSFEKKSIDGVNYYIARDNSDDKIYLYRENPGSDKEKIWSNPLQLTFYVDLDFYYDEPSKTLFVVDGDPSTITKRIISYTEGSTSAPKEIFKKTEGSQATHDCYGLHIERVYSDAKKILALSGVATHCEGNPANEKKAALIDIDSSEESLIKAFTVSMAAGKDYANYLGLAGGSLFFADYRFVKDETEPFFGGYGYLSRIFKINPISMEMETIIADSTVLTLAPITRVEFLEGDNNILLLKSNQDKTVLDENGLPSTVKGEQKSYKFDLAKKSFVEK